MMEKKERSEKKEVSPYEIVERGRIFELRRGINYLADNIEKAKDILSMIVSHFGGIPAWIFTSYAIHRLETNAKLTRNYEELLEIETGGMSHFFKPEFLRGYKFTFGGAKKGGLSYFDELGNITNFSGTLYDIFSYAFEVAPEFIEDTIKQYIPMPKETHIPEYIKNVGKDYILKTAEDATKLTFENFVKKLQFKYTELELATVRGTGEFFHFTERQDEIKERGSKKELGSGGWVVHPTFRAYLTGERREGTPPITFMLTKDAEIEGKDKTIKLKKETPLSKDVEAIADSGQSLPWGIAKVKDRSGEFADWLVKPEPYKNTVTYINSSGEKIREESPALKVAGILWLFDFDEGMFVGGDKAPGSSVAAPLNPLFTDLLLQKDENKKKFNEAVGKEAKKFVAALEVRFKDRKTEIPWYEGYDYPIFFPTREYQEKFQKYFIGVHRIDHVKEIVVKDVFPL
jgi:hypothetical protein